MSKFLNFCISVCLLCMTFNLFVLSVDTAKMILEGKVK